MRRAGSWLLRAGLVVGVSVALVVAGFESLDAVAGPFILGDPRMTPDESPIRYGGALVVLLLLHGAASWLVWRDPSRGRFAWWLVGASASGAVWFGGLALLSASFWGTARPGVGAAETVGVGALYVIVLAGPSLASLAASVLTAFARSRRTPLVLPPAAFLITASVSVAIPVVHSAVRLG
jgi:hypothetical protein